MNERVEAAAQHHKAEPGCRQAVAPRIAARVEAPQDGIIKDLATHTRGTVVQPGTILKTLVPHDEPMAGRGAVANIDAGFVRAGVAKISWYPIRSSNTAWSKAAWPRSAPTRPRRTSRRKGDPLAGGPKPAGTARW